MNIVAADKKICERCQKEFSCKANDIVNCECYGIEFTENSKEILKKYNDCLCRICLDDINNSN